MEITDKQKIEALERIVTAIVGRQEAVVTYKRDFEEQTRIVIDDCDPEDVMKIKSSLQTAEIEFDFYVHEREVPEAERSIVLPNPWEGICELTFYVEERAWKIIQEQKQKIAELTKQIEEASQSKTFTLDNSNNNSVNISVTGIT